MFIVTGTPGTGKTTFAKKYAKENGLVYLNGNDIIAENSLVDEVDEERDVNVIDESKFADVCVSLSKDYESKGKNIIIDSHLSHYIDPKFVEKCFVMHCDLSVLNERLKKRGYSNAKVRENLDSEIFNICELEAKDIGHNIEIITS